MKHSATNNFTDIKQAINLSDQETPFSKILGYDDIKTELNLIRSWYLNKDIERDEKIVLPKGIIFYGPPGTGKTLFTSELAKSFNWPIVVIEGKDQGEIIENIHASFKKARNFKEKKAIIVIDEMDLLLERSDSIAHALQTEIDGFNKTDITKLFVIATTNHLYDIPKALQRPGRFDRLIRIGLPNDDNRILLFKKFLEYYNFPYQNIDFPEIARVIKNVSGADIKAICNDAYLRINNNITTDELIFSYERVINNNYLKEEEPKRTYLLAIHEAGHVIASLKNSDFTFFHHSTFVKNGAVTRTNVIKQDLSIVSNVVSDIEISLGGIIAEKLILKKVELGGESDISNARERIYKMIERSSCYGIKYFTESHNCDRRYYRISEKLVLKKETLWLRVYKRLYRSIYKYLKRHKEDIIKVADFLYQNGKVTYKDIPSLNLSIIKSQQKITQPLVTTNKPVLALNSTSKDKMADKIEDELNKEVTD